jgi:hypothetical protein
MTHTILRGRWCDIVLNVHAPTEDRIDDVCFMKDSIYEELEHVFDKFPKYHMKMLDFNAKVGGEDIFRPTTGNESLHKSSKLCHIQKSVKSTMFPHCNIHKFSWTSPDGKTQST